MSREELTMKIFYSSVEILPRSLNFVLSPNPAKLASWIL